MTRLFIDCTGTYYSKLNTGIQRVVKNIIARKAIFHDHGFEEVIHVVQLGGNYCKLNINDKLPLRFTSILHNTAVKLKNIFDALLKVSKNQTEINSNKNLDSVSPENMDGSFYTDIMSVLREILKKFFSISTYIDTCLLSEAFVSFNQGDVLFLPDAFWYNDVSIDTIKTAKNLGAKIIIFFHDIISLTHPQLMEDKNVLKFKTKFVQILPLLDGYICNSSFTISEVAEYLNKYYPAFQNLPSGFVHLGYDLDMDGGVSNGIIENCGNQSDTDFQNDTYLMVGTIEPRKNYDFVVNAFHKLWENGVKVKLVIVGRIGWKNRHIIERIIDSPYKDQYLFMYNNLPDNELIGFYSKCKALIIASSIEGFGLPLVEAIAHKKLVLSSDIPIFREIGQSYPVFFDLNNENSLVDAVKKIECGEVKLNSAVPEMQTWTDCVNQIAYIIVNKIIK